MKLLRTLLLCLTLFVLGYHLNGMSSQRPNFTIEDFEVGANLTRYKDQEIPLENLVSGAGIVAQYQQQSVSPTPLDGKAIFSYAVASCGKERSEYSSREILCHDIIFSGLNALVESIVPHLALCPHYQVTIVAFGGAVRGAGCFYLKHLEDAINRKLDLRKKVVVVPSALGDERTLIGAAGIALRTRPAPKRSHILSIDMGGTNVRIGLVDISSMRVDGEIVSIGTFANDKEFNMMRQLRSIIQEHSNLYPNLFAIPDSVTLRDFLPSRRTRSTHNQLRNSLLDRMCALINEFSFDDIECISIASPGLNREDGYVKLAYNAPLTGVYLVQEIQKRIAQDIPVVVTGDVSSAGIGELLAGEGKDLQQFFVLGIGTGINLCYIERCRTL